MDEKRISEATLTEAEKAALIQTAIETIRQLMPRGVEMRFTRARIFAGLEVKSAVLEINYQNGGRHIFGFRGCSPIHAVSFANAVDEMLEREVVR